MLRTSMVACSATLLGTACAPSVTKGGFDNPNSASRLYAIEQAMRNNDTAAAPCIVELLDSDDPAVRMLAITALERLTGETYGYRFDDPRFQRDDAIQQWVRSVGPCEETATVAAGQIGDADG